MHALEVQPQPAANDQAFRVSKLVAPGALQGAELVAYASPAGDVILQVNHRGVCIFRQSVALQPPAAFGDSSRLRRRRPGLPGLFRALWL